MYGLWWFCLASHLKQRGAFKGFATVLTFIWLLPWVRPAKEKKQFMKFVYVTFTQYIKTFKWNLLLIYVHMGIKAWRVWNSKVFRAWLSFFPQQAAIKQWMYYFLSPSFELVEDYFNNSLHLLQIWNLHKFRK